MSVIPDFAAKFAMDRACLAQLRKLGVVARHVFDVGACSGAWTRHVRPDFPETTFDMFEPLADHGLLREKLELTIQDPLCRLHKVALGPESKPTTMFMYPDNVPGSTALDLGFTPQNAQAVAIQMLTIDDAIAKLGLPVPNLIKMDTQGCELEILKGARQTLPKVDVLLLECWLKRSYGPRTPLLMEVAEWLRQFDFYLWDLADQWRDDKGNLGSQDCFFMNAKCPASPLSAEIKTTQSRSKKETRPAWRKLLDRLF